MSMAQLLITAVTVERRSLSEVARQYGVSRRWVQLLVRRYEAEGEAAFEPRSRRPRSSPARTPDELEDEVVHLRKCLLEAGLDAGAATIAYHLAERHSTDVPSVSTVWRVLRRRGFVVPEPHKRPRSSYVRFCAELPNERWQADVTHVRIAGGYEVEVLNQLDDCSRLLVGSDAKGVFSSRDVVRSFAKAAAAYGTPHSYLTDNGAVFTGAYRGGWVALERELVARGVRLRHSRPYHPQTCGKVERFHQTLKKYLARQEPARTVSELQRQLDVFREYYNDYRPHRALGRTTPRSVYDSRPKAAPSASPLALSHYRTRRDVVDAGGTVTLRHASRLHHIGLGRAWAGTRVLVLVHDLEVRVVTDDGELVRTLTLDPTRDYQPVGKRV